MAILHYVIASVYNHRIQERSLRKTRWEYYCVIVPSNSLSPQIKVLSVGKVRIFPSLRTENPETKKRK